MERRIGSGQEHWRILYGPLTTRKRSGRNQTKRTGPKPAGFTSHTSCPAISHALVASFSPPPSVPPLGWQGQLIFAAPFITHVSNQKQSSAAQVTALLLVSCMSWHLVMVMKNATQITYRVVLKDKKSDGKDQNWLN